MSKHSPKLRDFITSLCHLSSYFIKSEKYTPHPNHPGVESSDHGSDGPWKTTYVDAPVRLTVPTSLRSLGQQFHFVPLASPQYHTQCVRRTGSQAHRVSLSSFDFRPCSNITSATSTPRRAKWAHPHFFPSLIKENVGSLTDSFITEVAYRTPGNSVANAYLPPSVVKRPNLTVAVSTVVERVLFDESGSEPRAVGVEVSKSAVAPKYRIKANREVIICGGTIASPHLLLVSGIGPKEELSKAGIKVVKDLSQVGKNYRDVRLLPSCGCSYKFTTVDSIFHPVPFVCAPSLVSLLTF